MKKKVLILALSLLGSAGMIWSMQEEGEDDSLRATRVIFLTDRYQQGCYMGTFFQNRMVNVGDIIMEQNGDVVVVEQGNIDRDEPSVGTSD